MTRIERAIEQLERIHYSDSEQALVHLRAVVEEFKALPTFNEGRIVKELERLQHRTTLTVQDITILAERIKSETMP